MSQFRQFWINENKDRHFAGMVCFDNEFHYDDTCLQKNKVHAIEIAALEAAQKEIEQLTAALKVAEDALEFYANNSTSVWDCNGEHEIEHDSGKARQALEEIQKIKKGLG